MAPIRCRSCRHLVASALLNVRSTKTKHCMHVIVERRDYPRLRVMEIGGNLSKSAPFHPAAFFLELKPFQANKSVPRLHFTRSHSSYDARGECAPSSSVIRETSGECRTKVSHWLLPPGRLRRPCGHRGALGVRLRASLTMTARRNVDWLIFNAILGRAACVQ